MSVIHTERPKPVDARILIIPVLLAAAFLLFFFRLWYLNIANASALVEKAEGLRTSKVSLMAPRGLIYDRRGRPIASVKPEIVITAIPAIVKNNSIVLKKLAHQTGLSVESLKESVDKGAWRPYLPTPVVRKADIKTATWIAESGDRLPGLDVQSLPLRVYADTKSMAHVLGYVWTPDQKDVDRFSEQGRRPGSYVGKLGIEYQYEFDLMGSEGFEKLEVDNRRRPVRSLASDNPVPGRKLILSVDLELQRYALSLLAGKRGAIVAIDPSNGEVVCLVSSPTYDTAVFEGGLSKTEYAALQADEDKPQINRAINAAYAPGSTFKIVTTVAAIQAGVFDPNRYVVCPGYLRVGNKNIKCLGRHGAISFQRAFAKSCNTYFMTHALRAGPDALRKASLQFGLGARSGIDLRSESSGVVPTREWIAKHKRPAVWYPGNTAIFGIGQGEISTTPLQMACVAAMVAQDGELYKPHVLRAIVPPGPDSASIPTLPEIFTRVDVPTETWSMIRKAMRQVIEDGTAGRAKIAGLDWGGKTGSAENHMKRRDTHSWFVGIAPIDKPRIALAVLVENAGHGGDVAAPIARQLVSRYLGSGGDSGQFKDGNRSSTSAAAEASPISR